MTEPPLGAEDGRGRLTLVGVVHLDPGGENRLGRLLEDLEPDLITLQISPYALRWRRRNLTRLRDRLAGNLDLAARRLGLGADQAAAHGAVQAVAAQLEVPFEFLAARAYQRRFGGRIGLVEDSDVSRRLLGVFDREVLSVDNLIALLGSPDVPLAARSRGLWRRAGWGVDPDGAESPEGEAALAAAVARAHHRFDPRAHVHVCGFTHLVPLQGLLRHLGIEVRRLDEEGPHPERSGGGPVSVPNR
jgi:hypothetical protein